MFGFDLQTLLAIALIAAGGIGFAVSNWSKISGSKMLPWNWTRKATVATTEGDEDTLDFQAHNRLQKRFTRLGCKEGLDACSVQLQHFYHGTEGHK